MIAKNSLLKKLDQLVLLAEDQNRKYLEGRDALWKGLVQVYLWWREAKRVDGFLEECYSQHNIASRENDGEEKFTRILRLIWRMQWSGPSAAKLQQWSIALRKIHVEFETNSKAYRTDAASKLVHFIETEGGVRGLIGVNSSGGEQIDSESKSKKSSKKSKISSDDEKLVFDKHLELGELYFDKSGAFIRNISSNEPFGTTRKGYALALVRQKSPTKFDILSTVNDDDLLEKMIVSAYKRSNDTAPYVLALLAEVITTQSLPIALERHRYTLADNTKLKNEKGESIRQNKRLLLRKNNKDIILSESRTSVSVVTHVVPTIFPSKANGDLFLNANDRRYIEQVVIQQRDLGLFTADGVDSLPKASKDIKASHRLAIENVVTGKVRSLYFYDTSVLGDGSRPQAYINTEMCPPPIWTAKVDRLWLERFNVFFVSDWLRHYGDQITRNKHKSLKLELSKQKLAVKHYGEGGNFAVQDPKLVFAVPKVDATSKPCSAIFLAKDLMPVLNGLMESNITGDVQIAMCDSYLAIGYKTKLASYKVYVPTCSKTYKRNSAAFASYGA